jgi:hypothetical protein
MHLPARRLILVLAAAGATACGESRPEDSYSRGNGLKVAALPAGAEPQIIDASIRAAFDVVPELVLRMHPRRLPRTAGDSGGDAVPPALVRALRERGIVAGSCEPVRSSPKNTPHCSTAEAGYIIRTSDVFAVSRDTVSLNFAAEKFGASTGAKPEALRFEKIYKLVKDGREWRVAREGRIRP